MTIYTLESETGNISAFPTAEAAVAGSQTPFDVFTSQQELAELMTKWPADRLLSTYNSLPGVPPLKKLQDPQRAASKIWQRIARLGQAINVEPSTENMSPVAGAAKHKTASKATVSARVASGAPAPGKAKKKAPAAPGKANKTRKTARSKATAARKSPASAPRAGSKMAQVIALLQRKQGASITEIMHQMGWQRHTVRGVMAGALKKAGYAVEPFKPDGGERSYRLPR